MPTGIEHRIEQIERLCEPVDFQRYLPLMMNVRATVLEDIWLDIISDCSELETIDFDGKEYPQVKFRIRANKYLKRVVSKEYAQEMTTEVADIALETLQYYFTIYR
jgi:hypothetical protein